jgi:hypothetical protein
LQRPARAKIFGEIPDGNASLGAATLDWESTSLLKGISREGDILIF